MSDNEVVIAVHEICRLPRNIHWFCPITDPDDELLYFEEDVSNDVGTEQDAQKRQAGLQQFAERKQLFLKAFDILAYDTPASEQFTNMLKTRISESMLGCGTCVREYYRILSEKRDELDAAYDSSTVEEFFLRVDFFNNDRISNRLSHCRNQLERLPESQRKLKSLDVESVFAFLEAMASPVYAQNESLLARHFDEPFKLLNGIKKLKPDSYLPAMTSFLFSSNRARVDWAHYNWARISRAPTRREFEGAVRAPLLAAMTRVYMENLDRAFLTDFWNGMRIIVSHLNADLITHCLRGIGGHNIFTMALDHLHQDLEMSNFLDVIATTSDFLSKAPTAYWDALGTINPQTVVEQILAEKNLRRLLQEENLESLTTALEIVEPFLGSLKPDKQPSACRSIVQHLITKWRDRALSGDSRRTCFNASMTAIKESAQILISSANARNDVDPSCIGELLDLFDEYASDITNATKLFTNQTSIAAPPALLVIQKVVELDVASLAMAHHAISSKRALLPHHFAKTGRVYKIMVSTVKSGRAQALATRILLGSRRLAMLEPFIATKTRPLSKDMLAFNAAFENVTSSVCEVLETINDWQPRDINSIFKSTELASGLIAALFYAPQPVRIAAVEILKTMGDKDDRRDAARQILDDTYLTATEAFAQVIASVDRGKQYSPHSAAIRILSDVMDSLCNSQDGLLRSKDLNSHECDVTLMLWQNLWKMLTTIFRNTEQWSRQGHDKADMLEFCRDVMQFAEGLYDYHAVFVSSLLDEDADAEAKSNMTHELLQYPNNTMSAMVEWLRLADEFLIAKIVIVFNTLLSNLRTAKLTVASDVLDFVEQILSNKIKVKLTAAQRASVTQSLEAHGGVKKEPLIKQEKGQKQASISGWAAADGAVPSNLKDRMAKVVADNTKASSHFKDLKAQFGHPAVTVPKKMATPKEADQEFMRQRLADREADQKRRAAAAQARKQKLALLQAAEKKEKGIMVSSEESDQSSEEEEDEDDMDKILFGIKKVSKPRSERTVGDMKVIDTKDLPRGPVKVKKQLRTTNDIRARLAPSLTTLHSHLLSWDYFHTDDVPPGSDAAMYKGVQAKYSNPLEYKQIFEPLLSLEAWQGFVKAREEGTFKPFRIKVANRSNVDSFIEISTVMPMTDNREVQEADIVLLSLSENPTKSKELPHCLARVHKVSYKKKKELEIVYRAVSRGPMIKEIRPEMEIWGVKIQSLTPLEREYGVLQSLQYYDLCDYVLDGKPSALLDYTDAQLTGFMRTYDLNKAQSKAVHSALDNDAFTLIQGPPGSGKTKTIVAIVGALLSDTLKRGSGDNDKSKKLLVCAPSNAAVDELVMRFKRGIKDKSGHGHQIKVVRVGRSDAVNSAVQDVTLEELLKARLTDTASGQESQRAEISKLINEHKEISGKLQAARTQLDKDETEANKENLVNLKRQRMDVGARIDTLKDAEKTIQRNNELERRKAQKAIVDEAHIICATLSGSGHEMFQSLGVDFETVVVDEAAQCVEASALIPLKYGCTKCILVGDPKQLPPTVLSKEASRYSYEKSMFVRMQENYPKDVHLLDTQYRMHTEISQFPSSAFYDGRLLDGPDMDALRRQPWHCNPMLAPYRFFHVEGQHQMGKFHSLINTAEIQVAIKLYDRVTSDFASHTDFNGKIGIITPYKSQLHELKNQFARRYGQGITSLVEFNTTDAFQGREAEIIIFSCVRASPSGGVGFLQDIRRMNVGLTRAKSSLWVLGNSDSLTRGEYWRMLIDDAKKRGHFIQGNYQHDLQQPTSHSSKTQWFKDNPTLKPQTPGSTGLSSANNTLEQKSLPLHGNGSGVTSSTSSIPSKRHASIHTESVPDIHTESSEDIDMPDADQRTKVSTKSLASRVPETTTPSTALKSSAKTSANSSTNKSRSASPATLQGVKSEQVARPIKHLQEGAPPLIRKKRPPANPLLNRPKKPRPP